MKINNLLLIAMSVMMCLYLPSCSLLDDAGSGPGSGSGSGSGGVDDDDPLVLTASDFTSDLVLENRNGDVDYFVDAMFDVRVDLEIKAGVVIEFAENAGLDIHDSGTILAVATQDDPILFTGELKSKGSWTGIIVESASLKNQFEYCEFRYGGSRDWGFGVQGGLSTWNKARMNVDNCTFRDNQGYGVRFYPSDQQELRSFENNSFRDNDKDLGLSPWLVEAIGEGNTFVGGSQAIDIFGGKVFKGSDIGETKLWRAHAVPYKVLGEVSIDDNNLELAPGSEFFFDEIAFFEINDDASLYAKGTATSPIAMKGLLDVSGSWPGIAFNYTENSRNLLENVIIENAGGGQGYFEKGAIYMYSKPELTVNNCTFINGASCIFHHASSGENDNLSIDSNNYIGSGAEFCN